MSTLRQALVLVAFALVALVNCREVPEEALNRDRRGLWDGIVSTVSCTPTVVEAAQKCGKELDDKVKGRENDQSKDMQCCMYAEYRRCVHSSAVQSCGADASNVVDTVVKGIQSTLSSDCDQYQAYSATCITIIWWNYIIVGAIVAVILAIGCCLGSCCCRS